MPEQYTFATIMGLFAEQFPGLKISDMRPNGHNQIYVWLDKSPVNLVATFNPRERTFLVESTYYQWGFLKGEKK